MTTVRIATGSQLPKRWRPGQPLTRGRTYASAEAIAGRGCSVAASGRRCHWCETGARWNRTEHVSTDPQARRRRVRQRRM